MKTLLVLLLCLPVFRTYAQSLSAMEQRLMDQYHCIEYWAEYQDPDHGIEKFDSLEAANVRFQKSLLRYTAAYPSSLKYKFPKLAQALTITTSQDGLLRLYTWDTFTGGTMKVYANVCQYKANKVGSTVLGDSDWTGSPGFVCTTIHQFQHAGQTYYFIIQDAVLATLQCYENLQVVAITGKRLKDDVKLIKTKEGLTSNLGFDYNIGLMEDRQDDDELIKWDQEAKTITIPVVVEYGKVTLKNIVYKFTGRYFEKQ